MLKSESEGVFSVIRLGIYSPFNKFLDLFTFFADQLLLRFYLYFFSPLLPFTFYFLPITLKCLPYTFNPLLLNFYPLH